MEMMSGIPTVEDYNAVLNSELFLKMEIFSNNFLERNISCLANYSRKWVADPLHQWSRQWEYPFVFKKILEYTSGYPSSNIKILDAGSGMSFFPYFISSNIDNAKITCCDSDSSLKDIFSNVVHHSKSQVDFIIDDIGKIPYKENTFDIIYCISVLEHTENFEQIIREFKRLLKYNGILIVTFDISIRGDADIPPRAAEELLQTLNKYLVGEQGMQSQTLVEGLLSTNVLTTEYIRVFNRNLLPWKFPFLSALKPFLRFRIPTSTFINLTCYCGVFRNEGV